MNYFEFYGLEPKFKLDSKILKMRFLDKSKLLHPDYNTDESLDQDAVLEQAAANNLAYQTLKDRNKRYRYLIELCGLEFQEGKETVPQEFLFEVMELNEKLFELDINFSDEKYIAINQKIDIKYAEISAELEETILKLDKQKLPTKSKELRIYLLAIKGFLLKNSYLDRMLKNLKKLKPSI